MKLFFLCSLLVLFAGWSSFEVMPKERVFYHPVTTTSEEAQAHFNRGLLAIYAFNYDAAANSFIEAGNKDPDMAMAYWGLALALDQGLSNDIPEDMAVLTYELADTALYLSKNVTPNEKAYIEALQTRFSSDPKADKANLRIAYRDAMEKVAQKYPDDPDAETLYAEGAMDVMNWTMYSHKGVPREGCEKVVAILEEALKNNPLHPGANHYYIHALESSKNPQRALMSAYRLDGAYPEWGHLLHTPTHIYMRVGDYEKTVHANLLGVKADREYIKKHGTKGTYPVHYLNHNLFYLGRAYLWLEDYARALETARELETLLLEHINEMSSLESNLMMPLQTFLYFHKWNEILEEKIPEKSLKLMTAFSHFARSMAYLNLGQKAEAEKERTLFLETKKESGDDFLDIAQDVLNADFLRKEKKFNEAETTLRNAVDREDQRNYLNWYHPLRQTLGAFLLERGKSEEAEKTFRETLEKLPRNGRSLFGLTEALKALGKEYYWTERDMREALKGKTLEVEELF